MSSTVKSENLPAGSFKRWCLGLLMGLAAILFTAGAVYLYQREMHDLLESMQQERALIVLRELQSIMFFAPILFMAFFLFIVVEFYFVDHLKKPVAGFGKYIQYACGVAIIAGPLLMVFGGSLLNPFWYSTLDEEGYVQCDNEVLLLSKSATHSAWVRNPLWCFDPNLKNILMERHSTAGFEQASRYLENAYVDSGGD